MPSAPPGAPFTGPAGGASAVGAPPGAAPSANVSPGPAPGCPPGAAPGTAGASGGAYITRRSLPDGVDGLLNEIRRAAPPTATGGHSCLEMLDLCGCGLDDGGATKLFEVLTRLQVASRRLLLSGNGLGDSSMSALSAYLWHSPEPLWELALAENKITDKGVEDLLRCLYNHPSHPPKLPGSSGPSGGPAFPLRFDAKNNCVGDHEGLRARIESAGQAGAVQLCVTPGDGPAPPPAEPGRPAPYLWVFLPRFAEQHKAKKAE